MKNGKNGTNTPWSYSLIRISTIEINGWLFHLDLEQIFIFGTGMNIYIYTFSWTYFFPILLATSRFIFISFVFVDFMEILRFFLDFFAKKDWALPKPGLCLGGPVLSVRSFSTWKPPFFSAFFQWASWMQRKKQLQTLEPPRAEPSQEPRQPKLWSKRPMEISRRFCWKRSVTHGRGLLWRLIDSSWCFVSCSLGRICGKAWNSKGPLDLTSPNLDAKNTFVGSNYLMEIDHFFSPFELLLPHLKKNTSSSTANHSICQCSFQQKTFTTASVHRLPRFCLASMQGVKELIPAWAGISGFRQSLQLDRWHFSLHFCWVDSQEFLDLWEFVYEFMIQLYRGWILNPNVGIVLHDSVYCFDDCLGPVQHSLSAAKRLFRRTFDKAEFPFHIYKSGITWIIGKETCFFADHSILALCYMTHDLHDLIHSSLSVASIVAIQGAYLGSWTVRNSSCSWNLFPHRSPTTNGCFCFFWENQTGQEPEAHCFEERVFHTSRSPNMCCPFIRPFWRTIFYSLALWAPRLRLDVPWLRNSRRMGCFGISFWPETNQQKNAARPSEFFWELHGPNVPWDLTEILLPAGWFLATSIP